MQNSNFLQECVIISLLTILFGCKIERISKYVILWNLCRTVHCCVVAEKWNRIVCKVRQTNRKLPLMCPPPPHTKCYRVNSYITFKGEQYRIPRQQYLGAAIHLRRERGSGGGGSLCASTLLISPTPPPPIHPLIPDSSWILVKLALAGYLFESRF